jgi:hypothetical protein
MLVLSQVVAIALVLIIAFLRPQLGYKCSRAAWRAVGRIARRRGLALGLIFLLAAVGSAGVSLLTGTPQPHIHDEFSYLLAADTFAHGRLTNPTHPMWAHFESFHIIQQPTYASVYPPAQGLMLAVGQVLVGHPITGVWISIGLACAAIYWMLLAWLRPKWALLGGLLAALHPGILITWGQSYWGGAVAVIGGALVFGALRRIMLQPRLRDALLMGLGLAVLANSRPYEGFVVSLPVVVALLIWFVGKCGPPVRVSIGRIVLPIFVVLTLTAGAMGYYNLRVTGDPLRLPRLLAYETYGMAPVFLWQNPRPEPTYRHKVMWDFYVGRELSSNVRKYSVPNVSMVVVKKFKRLWQFYLGLVLTAPLVALPWVLRNRWMRFALSTCGVFMAAFLLHRWAFPHYAAPIAGLVFALVLQAMRHVHLWHWRGRPTGRFIVRAIPVICAAWFVLSLAQKIRVNPAHAWSLQRARMLAELKKDGERHLVIVRYGPEHSPGKEWVYNEANIDVAKVVWAREMDPAQNRRLLEYFQDRRAWLLEVIRDDSPLTLVLYPAGAGRDSDTVIRQVAS